MIAATRASEASQSQLAFHADFNRVHPLIASRCPIRVTEGLGFRWKELTRSGSAISGLNTGGFASSAVLTSVLYDLARTTAEGCYCQESWEPQPVWWSTYAREGLSALEKWRNQERELGETEL